MYAVFSSFIFKDKVTKTLFSTYQNYTMSDYLCEELIEEIFERLPPKSLLRFRCLSKSWCSRISSPDFIHTHARRSSTKTLQKILVRQQVHFTKENVEYSLHRPKDQYKIPGTHCIIAGSCSGMILLHKCYGSTITLWNPSIRRKQSVPNHPYEKLHVALGFGFDSITDDYKIVGIYCSESVHPYLLYSMKTNSWSEIGAPTTPIYRAKSSTCFFNGVLHWVVQSKPKTDNWYIMTFDLSSHVFGTITLPKPSWKTIHITIIKDLLAVISSDGCDRWMWVMKEYNNVESWSKPLKLPINEKFKGYNPFTNVVSTSMSCLDSSYILYMDFYGESLELLGMETCSYDE